MNFFKVNLRKRTADNNNDQNAKSLPIKHSACPDSVVCFAGC